MYNSKKVRRVGGIMTGTNGKRGAAASLLLSENRAGLKEELKVVWKEQTANRS